MLLAEWRRRLGKLQGLPCELGLSIGIALVDTRKRETSRAMIDRADRAMYQAKQAGKGQYFVSKGPTGKTESGR